MPVTSVDITGCRPLAAGQSFAAAGAYERLDGLVHFAVDPNAAANAGIVDLDLAPRDRSGRVAFEADLCLLQPVDAARGNRNLLFYVVNRGRLGTVPLGGAAAPQVLGDEIDPGDGFLMRHGWTVLMVGWQWDVVRRVGHLGLEAPLAYTTDDQVPPGRIVVQFQPDRRHPTQVLAHWPLHPPPGRPEFAQRPYPAADVDDATAELFVRATPNGQRSLVPRQQWRFATVDAAGQPVADDCSIWLDGGFQPGLLYEVVYQPRIAPVVGTGLLAVRDAVTFWRYATVADGNPSAGRIDRTFGFGISQCGRFLRDFLYLGLNQDEQGRRAFDGLLPHVAGARRGEFNMRFGQPSVQHVASPGHLPPFADDDQTDAVAGWTDGLLRRQRAAGDLPKIVTTNSSSEYWRSDCSLTHTDPAGTRDLDLPAETRLYLFAGTQHGAGAPPLNDLTPSGVRTANPMNLVDYTPLLRAALTNLATWVATGEEPPANAVPRLADGTAIAREQAIETLQALLPTAALPAPAVLPTLHRLAKDAAGHHGHGPWPPALGPPYGSYVSALDADGNELAGLRLPDLTVPLATHAGWNPRHAETGGQGQLVDMQGSSLPFARSAAERTARADPRPSIPERYRDRQDYLNRVRLAAELLVAARHVLAEDVPALLANAEVRWQALAD